MDTRPPLPPVDALVARLIDALDAGDADSAAALLQEHDAAVRAYARDADAAAPAQREALISLQQVQLAVIELLRGRRDAVGGELQQLAAGTRATRAYRGGAG